MEETDQAHFDSIPWCSQLIRDPTFKITPTFSRQPKSSTEDSLIAETLNTKETVSACLTLYKVPQSPETFVSEIRILLSLGSGLNGGAHVLHGGITAALFDDAIGVLLTLNKEKEILPRDSSTVTAFLNVRYLKRIGTPATVVMVVRCEEIQGRKYFMKAEVRDGEGTKLAEADSLWILLAELKQKL